MVRKLHVLLACEESGVVRRAFRDLGHEAWSCDLLPARDESPFHLQRDVLPLLGLGWDLMVGFPPCTHLAVSGARWFKEKPEKAQLQLEALDFVRALMAAPIPHIAIENPVSVISSQIRKPDQIVQPYWFGHEATKTTCLWLKNLPKLEPTNLVGKGARHVTKSGRSLPEWYNLPPSPDRARIRSETFEGFGRAMAEQYSAWVLANGAGAGGNP